MAYNTNFFADRIYTSGHNILGYLEQYNHGELVDPMVSYLATKRNVLKYNVYKELIDRSAYMNYIPTFKAIDKEYYNMNLKLMQINDNIH